MWHTEIEVANGADLIIGDGDDPIPDIFILSFYH